MSMYKRESKYASKDLSTTPYQGSYQGHTFGVRATLKPCAIILSLFAGTNEENIYNRMQHRMNQLRNDGSY